MIFSPTPSSQIKDKGLGKLMDKLEKVERQLVDHPLASAADLRYRLSQLQHKRVLEEKAKVSAYGFVSWTRSASAER